MGKIRWYNLDDNKNIIPVSNVSDINDNNKIVQQDTIKVIFDKQECEFFISTVFLSLDHNYSGKGDPILFETMIFNNSGKDFSGTENYQQRYTSYEEAKKRHEEIIKIFTTSKTPFEDLNIIQRKKLIMRLKSIKNEKDENLDSG